MHAQLSQQEIEIIVSKDEVDRRIGEMGVELAETHKDRESIYVCLLHGGMFFTSKLMEAAVQYNPDFNPVVTTMIISRYGPNREPGQTRIVAPLPHDVLNTLPGKDVFFLDDLIDRGGTMQVAQKYALDNGAASASGIVLARKQQHPPVDVPMTRIGFDNLPNQWLLGMGMNGDHESYRWSGFIALDLRSELDT